jgi:hypothetical protein
MMLAQMARFGAAFAVRLQLMITAQIRRIPRDGRSQ